MPDPASMLPTAVNEVSDKNLGKARGADEIIVLAVDMPAQDALAGRVRNLAGDGDPPAHDIVGDIEQPQGRAEIVGQEAQALLSGSLPKRKDELGGR